MNDTTRLLPLALAVTAISAACASARQELPGPAVDHLDALFERPSAAGDLIYSGDVYAKDVEPGKDPAFRYERRVQVQDRVLTASHLTSDGLRLVVSQRAESSDDYALRQFEEVNRQTGVQSGLVVRADGSLIMERTIGTRREVREEGPGAPVVVGPTLFGFVVAHWVALRAGEPLRVRFAAVDRMQTYDFELRMVEQSASTTVVSFRPRSVFVRLAVDTMFLTFSSPTKHIVRYQGAVPPQLSDEGRLTPFDARVDYTFAALEYR